jgi:hypothetical protein
MLEVPSRKRRRGRRPFIRRLLLAVGLIAIFLLGMALGQALDDAPKSGDVVTSVRTLTPLPQQPPTKTVTVTVTQP